MLVIEISYNFLCVWTWMVLYDKTYFIYENGLIRSFGQPGIFKITKSISKLRIWVFFTWFSRIVPDNYLLDATQRHSFNLEFINLKAVCWKTNTKLRTDKNRILIATFSNTASFLFQERDALNNWLTTYDKIRLVRMILDCGFQFMM